MSDQNGRILLEETFTTNGNSEWVAWNPKEQGRVYFAVDGTVNTFGSGTVEVQYSPDKSAIVTDTGIELTDSAKDALLKDIPRGFIRMNMSGSTTPNAKFYFFPEFI